MATAVPGYPPSNLLSGTQAGAPVVPLGQNVLNPLALQPAFVQTDSGGNKSLVDADRNSVGGSDILVTGTAGVGNVLTASFPSGVGTVKWQNSPDGVTWTDIASATNLTYTQVTGDAGKRVRPLATSYAPFGAPVVVPTPPFVPRALVQQSLAAGNNGSGPSTGYYTASGATPSFDFRMKQKTGARGLPVGSIGTWQSSCTRSTSPFYVAAPNAFTVVETFLEVGGVSTRITWNGGANGFVFDSSLASPKNDPTTVAVAPNTDYYIRARVTLATAGLLMPAQRQVYPTNNSVEQCVQNGASSQASGTGPLVTSGLGAGGSFQPYLFGPSSFGSVQVASTDKIALVIGDSLADGTGFDPITDAYGNKGGFSRGCQELNIPSIKLARGSAMGRYATPANAPGYYDYFPQANILFLSIGTNDIVANRTFAQIRDDLLLIIAAARAANMKVIIQLILIRTDATNTFTGSFAEFAPGGVRSQLNTLFATTWLGNGTVDAVVDSNPLVENGSTGTWLFPMAGGTPATADNTHPNLQAYWDGLRDLIKTAINAITVP